MKRVQTLKRVTLATAQRKVSITERRYVVRDPLKLGIEPRIRPVVVALVAHGFPTQNSCEGHLWGNLYPWVSFEPPIKGKTKNDLLRHVKKIHCEVDQLSRLLHKFWQNTSPPPDRELRVTPDWNPSEKSDEEVVEAYLAMRARRFVALPGYMLECAGADTLLNMPSEVIEPYKDKILETRRDDMLNFAKFLVSKL